MANGKLEPGFVNTMFTVMMITLGIIFIIEFFYIEVSKTIRQAKKNDFFVMELE